MELKEGGFQFTNEGLFVPTRRNQETFHALHEAFDFLRQDEKHYTKITQGIKLQIDRDVLSKKKRVLIPELSTGTIHLKKTSLNKDNVKRFMESSEGFNFINSTADEGSFHWAATAIDKEKSSVFGISSNEKMINSFLGPPQLLKDFLNSIVKC